MTWLVDGSPWVVLVVVLAVCGLLAGMAIVSGGPIDEAIATVEAGASAP